MITVARKLGLSCGHFPPTEFREFDFEGKNSIFEYHVFVAPVLGEGKEYCEQCNDAFSIVRIQAWTNERDIPELT
jgi:hypothetical protein